MERKSILEKRRERVNLMQINISHFSGLLLALSLATAGIAIAANDLVYSDANSPIQRSDETSQESSPLGRLALRLSSGPEAMRALRGSQSENNHNKDRLELSLVEM